MESGSLGNSDLWGEGEEIWPEGECDRTREGKDGKWRWGVGWGEGVNLVGYRIDGDRASGGGSKTAGRATR